MASYMMKITKFRDECNAIQMKVESDGLLPIALKGFFSLGISLFVV